MPKKKQSKKSTAVVVYKEITEAAASPAPYEKRWLDIVEIEDENQLQIAIAGRDFAKEQLDKIEAGRLKITKPLLQSKKAADEQAKSSKSPWNTVVNHIDRLIIGWQNKLRKKEQKKAERRAKRFEKKGATDMAKDIRQEALAKPVMTNVEVRVQKYWSAEVVDIQKLCAEIAAGRVPTDAVKINEPWLNAVARKMKQEDLGIPGVKGVYKEGVRGDG
jgi:hypothetical protein